MSCTRLTYRLAHRMRRMNERPDRLHCSQGLGSFFWLLLRLRYLILFLSTQLLHLRATILLFLCILCPLCSLIISPKRHPMLHELYRVNTKKRVRDPVKSHCAGELKCSWNYSECKNHLHFFGFQRIPCTSRREVDSTPDILMCESVCSHQGMQNRSVEHDSRQRKGQ